MCEIRMADIILAHSTCFSWCVMLSVSCVILSERTVMFLRFINGNEKVVMMAAALWCVDEVAVVGGEKLMKGYCQWKF